MIYEYLVIILLFIACYIGSLVTINEGVPGLTAFFAVCMYTLLLVFSMVVVDSNKIISYVHLKPVGKSWSYLGEVHETGYSICSPK